MLLSDLIQPQANPAWRPPGGPVIPILPKAQSNAMGTKYRRGALARLCGSSACCIRSSPSMNRCIANPRSPKAPGF